MAIPKSIIAGLLALLLALPSPTLCYSDVVADEGSNHVQEGQTQEADQESLENEQEGYQDSNEPGSSGQQSNSPGAAGRSSGDGAALSVSSNANTEEWLEYGCGYFFCIATAYADEFDSSDSSSEYSDSASGSNSDSPDSDLQEAVENEADSSVRENSSGNSDSSGRYLVDSSAPRIFYDDPPDCDESKVICISDFGDIPAFDSDSITDIYFSEEAQTLTARAASGTFYVKQNATLSEFITFWGRGGWSAETLLTALMGITYLSGIGDNDQYFSYNLHNSMLYRASAQALSDSGLDDLTRASNSHLSNIYNRLATTNASIGNVVSAVNNVYERLASTNVRLDNLKAIYDRLETTNLRISSIYDRLESTNLRLDNLKAIYDRLETTNSNISNIYERLATTNLRLADLGSIYARLESTNLYLSQVSSYLFDSSTKRPLLQVIGDRLTAFMYQLDASQAQILLKLDRLAKDETVTTGFNTLDTHILLYLFGNNSGLPAHSEFLDNGLIYYIAQTHDDNKAFFDVALEFLEYMKDRLFYIEYDLVDYGMDIEPGFNRVIEAINTKQFDIQLENAAVSINLSGIESRLDTIITMLGIAGVKDLLETFLGDFSLDASSALAAAISSAMQNVFPFCIPAILKQCLGLMQAEAHAPVFEFDFFGSPLVLDFTAQGFCDISQVTSWFCRISFLILLLVNTKKFIFTINRGTQDG